MKYGYARVSTLTQQLKGNSLEEQTQELISAGIPEENIVKEQYSGRSANRPLFNQLIEHLQPGDELTCCKLDRFVRSAEDGLRIVRTLMERNISLRILNIGNGQPFDNSPIGQLLFTILLAFAQFERDLIIERTTAGKAVARTKEGYREGRRPIDKNRIDHAMTLLISHSYNQVAQMTGISKSTLQRYARARRDEEQARLMQIPRNPSSQGPEDEQSLFAFSTNKRPGRKPSKGNSFNKKIP